MVLALRPVIAAETDTALEPAPGAGLQGAVLPDGSVVPYSKVQLLTSLPLGLTFPFSVAVVWVIELAGSVSTLGAMITWNSYAPTSQAVPGTSGRVKPRWSTFGHASLSPASIAGLPASRAWVWVGPPLNARSSPSFGFTLLWSTPQ